MGMLNKHIVNVDLTISKPVCGKTKYEKNEFEYEHKVISKYINYDHDALFSSSNIEDSEERLSFFI